ncbi:MAG: hypothetical protein DMF91_16810 [Acidobacteria bacterium]|nr:MAG: hypothetical protein DMF91_16810 [Acidobacteriota bacterium]
MAHVRTRNRRLERLRTVRKKIAVQAKPGAERRLAQGLKRFNKDFARVRQAAAAGAIPRVDAKRALRLLAKIRRDLKRLTAATGSATRHWLAALDRDIERTRKEG